MSDQTESSSAGKSLIRVRPRGFCAGVVRAVDIVDLALQAYGPPVYVHHEIVHNRYVVEQLRKNGAIFVETVEEVPLGAVLVFSAHGVPPTTREEARLRELRVIDATCPLVTKVHLEALKFARENRTIILIGHRDHQEIVGTSGEAPQQTVVVDSVEAVDALEVADPNRLSFLTQTTLSLYDTQEIVARLRERFPFDRRPCFRRYLLRHAEPAGSRRATGARSGSDPGRRLAQQLELEPPGGSRQAFGSSGGTDRRRQGH